MPAADPITEMARKLCKKWPDAPSRTLARRLVDESRGALTINQARSRIRYQFGVHGAASRKFAKAAVKRKTRLAGSVLAMPASMAEPWVQFNLATVGRVGILSDCHVPYHDERAVAAAVNHIDGVDALVLNGDIADFYAISRWQKDPSQRDFKAELQAVRDFIAWIRYRFPKIPIVYKEGNHEERWKHWLWQHAPEISDEPMMSLSAWLKLDAHDVQLVEDQRPIMVGRLPVFHGHELPKGMASPVNPARGAYMRMKHTGLVGHSHRSSGHAESDVWHKETFNWSTGCLCDLTPEYARINGWNHGGAVVTVHKDGEFDVENFRITSGKVRRS
jgi:predicted phosphodiesterase